jgi:MarR family transcriptional repressor of emrRAB
MVKVANKCNANGMMSSILMTDEVPIKTLISLIQTSHEIYNEMSSKLSRFGLSQGKFRILLVLFRRQQPLKPSELAKLTGVTRSTMTGLIDGLERDGLIRRGVHEDRRATTIHLTEEGKELMNRLLPYYVEYSKCLMSELTKEDYDVLAGLLKKLKTGLERVKET